MNQQPGGAGGHVHSQENRSRSHFFTLTFTHMLRFQWTWRKPRFIQVLLDVPKEVGRVLPGVAALRLFWFDNSHLV